MSNEEHPNGAVVSVSRFAIRRPVTTTMFFIALILIGIVSYRQLPVQLLPDVDFPGAGMFVRYEGRSLEDMVEHVTKPLEAIAAATPHVREINSTSFSGFARIEIQYDFGTDMQFAVLDLQDKVAAFRKTLPRRGVYIGVRPFSTERMQTFLMELVVRGPDDRETLREIAEDLLQPQLEAIDGIAEVMVAGHYHDDIDVVFNREQLVAHRLELGRVIARIQAAAAGEIALGQVRGTRDRYVVTLGEVITTEEDLRQLPLDDRGIVRLADVAHIYRNQRQSEYLARLNGRNFVGLFLRKEADANILRLAQKVRQVVTELQDQLPEGYTVEVGEDAGQIIQDIIDRVAKLAIMGGMLAMLVLILFVRNLRMSAIVCTAIPISVVTTFNLMYFGGLSLNILSLIGLALGIGMLLDNSIVVLENIFRHFERSRHAIEACEHGTDEVWRALLATTLTNVVVFTPILYIEGEMSLIFREGALAIIFPVCISLLVALTLVPMLTSRVLVGRERHLRRARIGERLLARPRVWLRRVHPYWPCHARAPRRLYREFYMMALRSSLRHRVRLLLLVALLLYATIHFCIPMISQGTMQRGMEGDGFPVFVQVPRGTSYKQLVRVIEEIEQRILKVPEVERVRTFGEVEEGADIFVRLVPEEKRARELREVRETFLDQIGEVPGAMISLRPFERETAEPTRVQVAYDEGGEIEVRGAHWEALETVAEGLARQVELLPGIARVELERRHGLAEMQFAIDRPRAALFNLAAQDVAQYFATAQRGGQYSQIVMERGNRELDVRLRMGRPGRNPEDEEINETRPLSEIRELEIPSPLGGSVPLSELGYFRKARGERRVSRHNMQYSLDLVFLLEPNVDRKRVGEAVRGLLGEVRLPVGYVASLEGDERRIEENLAQLKWMLGITILLIYMVMASVFESLLAPFVILVSLPLAAIGVLWGMALSTSHLEEMAMLGIVVLAGIVVNNGIVMLDFVATLRRERRYGRTAALLTSCRARLRPILMTSLTTILGLLPMAVRSDEEFDWSGLAIVITCGLAAASLLTLLVIPSMLIIFEDGVALLVRAVRRVWRWRWLLHFYRPSRMRARRLELMPAGPALAFAPLFASVVARTAEAPQADAFAAPPALGRSDPAGAERSTGIVLRNVRMVYPVFHPRHFLHIIPSTRYKIGCRPPEGIEALRAINLTVEPGICGLIGPNGAGKTTLLKIITGLIRPTCGYVGVNGLDVTREGDRARREIGYLPQSFGLYGHLSAREYLRYYSLLLGVGDRAARERNIDAVLEQVGLREAADDLLAGFSGGMRQRVGIARLLLTVPRVILVDEPTAGLDPIERVKFRLLLSQLAQNRVVLLSTHIIDDISSSCKRLAVLHEGRLVYDGTAPGLIESARGRIWEHLGRFEDEERLAGRFRLLYKRAADRERVLYRFAAEACDLPGASPVEPTLEDAYLAT